MRPASGKAVEQPFTHAGGITDQVRDLPVLQIGKQLLGEAGRAAGMLLDVLRALVGEDVDSRVDGAGLGAFGDGEDGASGAVAGVIVEGRAMAN